MGDTEFDGLFQVYAADCAVDNLTAADTAHELVRTQCNINYRGIFRAISYRT